MRWPAIACAALAACAHGGGAGDPCSPMCGDGLVCRYDTCVAAPAACAASAACAGDQYCDLTAHECLPWGVGPGGTSDPSCAGAAAPGVGFPIEQCAWLGPPAGDAFPDHVNVLATPMVAALDDRAAPSIVFPAYNAADKGAASCTGGDPRFYGVIRVIDGRTCAQRATIASPTVIGSAPVAIGDLGGDDATPEIVAVRSQTGLVAFTHRAGGWEVLWQTAVGFAAGLCDWAGAAIHDLDDDGAPEVIFYGAVYNGQTGALIDDSVTEVDAIGVGYIPVVADVDGDGVPELVTGNNLYSWDRAVRRWVGKRQLPGDRGVVAVGDFGTFPAIGQDDRAHTDGIAEVAVVFQGTVRVFNIAGREVFAASFRGGATGAVQGGPPTIADFDGDGRVEIGAAGSAGYHVFDPDCKSPPGPAAPDPATCASRSSDGVLWTSATQNRADDLASSSAFDFDGDGRAELVHGDQCFTRIYDGATGRVVASRSRTSCLWYENPVVADTDGDFNAELIATSNASCSVACPAIDPIFDGVACVDDGDCAGATRCGRDPGDPAIGRCRCAQDADCGDGYACRDPSAGPSQMGKVCLAAHTAAAATGVHVLADAADRWIAARPIWNQHAYSVTNIDAAGHVPRTSQWLRNWTQPGFDTFRANAPRDPAAARAEPDLTIRSANVTCEASAPTVSAELCNRGGQPVAAGLPVAVYAATTPSRLRCQAQTGEQLMPGGCATVSCSWLGPAGDGAIAVDDTGSGAGSVRECREDNNLLPIHVACP
ncbi:MAG TPA: VCBS repeat-containing protein [Kofleriaceae bacterium]|nr:VCBS repeat-containing protein [Kofleriaceae bacterium]